MPASRRWCTSRRSAPSQGREIAVTRSTKGEGEARVRAAVPDAAILRPSLVFGPEDKFFNKFAWLARLSPALPLIGGGRTKFQPVFVGDVAEAILPLRRGTRHARQDL